MNLDYVELDIWLSKDNKVVVVHGCQGKVLDANGQEKQITEMSVEELKKISLNEKNDLIPTLDEILRLCKNKIKINIEMKGDQKDLPYETLKLVQKYQMLDQVYFSSFFHQFNDLIKEAIIKLNIEQKIKFAYLFSNQQQFPDINNLEEGNQLNFSSLLIYNQKARKLFKQAQNKNVKLCCYFGYDVLENYGVYKDLLDIGVQSIITNQPFTILSFRKNIFKN
ncbi:hypothetical protein IMG5_110110 [Ichthyophthirius multifiliis]|uniref:GP-PDE domain-containing protein n=1 Tax=Ichthyophthirius multifiliis TaxID=5932 RepID=G0QTN1_ICHMU|nr:hypothetical protein IMG5_110110 [Ichthyophthirius multifiliis]EGR31423.1 hypothetical protein IMG5_110110 [Ichthyophthirius multifiliis]|eukprot:XP_004034909.1 hypothetical protein IMG5_110110 [Ichthyophthirius multifiliis]